MDVVLPGGHSHTEKENVYIYLNDRADITGRSRTELPGAGSRDGVVADFDRDGFNDLAVANWPDSHDERVGAWIWYGSANGFSVERRVELPAERARSVAVGDFNGDEWLDLAFACEEPSGSYGEGSGSSLIFWNSASGFNPPRCTPLRFGGGGALQLAVADFDRNGRDDLAAVTGDTIFVLTGDGATWQDASRWHRLPVGGRVLAAGDVDGDGWPELAVCRRWEVLVLRGGLSGYGVERAIPLGASNPSDAAFADINRDGYDDLGVANYEGYPGATWVDPYVFSFQAGCLTSTPSLKIPTLGATAVTAADLNGDGYPELLFSNERVLNQLSICSYVFWNRGGQFAFGDHTQLPSRGSVGNTVGDVNNDGFPDVVLFNRAGHLRDGPAETHVYWGDGTRSFSVQRRTEIPTQPVFGYATTDLDDDGFVDLILAHDRFVYGLPHEQNGLSILWGGPEGLGKAVTRLTMDSGYGGVRIADVNGDGYLDIVAGGSCVDLQDPSRHGVAIFWGSATGFHNRDRTLLHVHREKTRVPLTADLNKDGWLDIAAQVEAGKVRIWWGARHGFRDERYFDLDLGRPDELMYINAADFDRDGWLDLLLPKRVPQDSVNTSFIYYGSPTGFSGERREEILSYVPYDNAIADFDRDGWLDIFLVSYGTDREGRNPPSIIHWGGPEGFGRRPVTRLGTYGASGAEAADYDADGWIDLFVANHRRAGSRERPVPHCHRTESMLFWGGPDGFSEQRCWEVPASGPSGLNVRDPGNSYDRGIYEDYESSPYRIPEGLTPARIFWKAETPHGTRVRFQVRVSESEEGLAKAAWIGPRGAGTWFGKSGSKIRAPKGRWIEYRARLESPNAGPTPYLYSVTIAFE